MAGPVHGLFWAVIVALTGGIASGKSTVAQCFFDLGIQSVDADDVVADLLAPGSSLIDQVANILGSDARNPDGSYNRAFVAEQVFNDANKLELLNQCIHPAVRVETQARLAALEQSYKLWVIPLLIETQQTEAADKIIVVDIPEALQVERLMIRSKLTEPEAQARIRAQATRQQRLKVADYVIDNTQGFEELVSQVKSIHTQLVEMT